MTVPNGCSGDDFCRRSASVNMPPRFDMSGPPSFKLIETIHGAAPFGHVLDAGTGMRSLRWLRSLDTDRITAVTGSDETARRIDNQIGQSPRTEDRLLVGNWADPDFLAGERFDTVLADHLIGAIDGFAPYFQTAMLSRLRDVTAGRLYLVGMTPYVLDPGAGEAGRLLAQIGRHRDACLLIAGQRPFREYPLDWVLAGLRQAGFNPIEHRQLDVSYGPRFVHEQIGYAVPALKQLRDQATARALIARGEMLKARALDQVARNGGIAHTHYLVAADVREPR
jgi:hypothetical protein